MFIVWLNIFLRLGATFVKSLRLGLAVLFWFSLATIDRESLPHLSHQAQLSLADSSIFCLNQTRFEGNLFLPWRTFLLTHSAFHQYWFVQRIGFYQHSGTVLWMLPMRFFFGRGFFGFRIWPLRPFFEVLERVHFEYVIFVQYIFFEEEKRLCLRLPRKITEKLCTSRSRFRTYISQGFSLAASTTAGILLKKKEARPWVTPIALKVYQLIKSPQGIKL